MQNRQYTELGDDLKRKLTLIAITCVAILSAISLLTMMIIPTSAQTPTQSQPADAMWVDPPSITLGPSSLGTEFNVTVWLNMTETIEGYQVAMLYNRTQLKCLKAEYTLGAAGSEYFSGVPESATPPLIDDGYLGNGSVLASEAALAPDNVTGPRSGSLIWVEFQVALVPTSGNLTSVFDISTEYGPLHDHTWVEDPTATEIPLTTVGNGNYTVTPEFEYLLILPILAAMTTFAVIVRKRIPKKS
jgi:hypothetical protein